MVHNGIEYGLMAAYAEGLNVLAKANIGARSPRRRRRDGAARRSRSTTSTTSTWSKVTEVWRRGIVVTSSWLLDLTAAALHADPQLDEYSGVVSDSGEGRWTIHAAIDEGVPVPVLSAALYERFSSRGRGRRGRQGPVRHACRLRRAPRTNGIHAMTPSHRHAQIDTNQPTADALVLFGATGDLAKRKLFPALYRLQRPGS